MNTLILIRPGATLFDEERRIVGALDVPLSDRGFVEANELASRFIGFEDAERVAAIYCGPSECACRTAEILGKAVGLRPKRLDDLRNLNQGLWQGLPLDEVRRRYQKNFRQWLEDPCSICPPLGENVEEALGRVRNALRPILKRHLREAIAVVVAEPLAGLIACTLSGRPLQPLDDEPAASIERIEIHPDYLRNGKH